MLTASTFRLTNIITMFTDPFMQRALLAALFLGPLCALLGVFVVARLYPELDRHEAAAAPNTPPAEPPAAPPAEPVAA